MLIPDYLVYEELQRQREKERQWEAEPIHLPIYAPEVVDRDAEDEPDTDDYDINRGVIIIDMNSVD